MRRQAREIAFAIIFERLFHLSDEFDGEKIDELTKPEDRDFARKIIQAFDENKVEIFKELENNISGYEIGRLHKVDLALLSLALTEVRHVETPCQVVINEVLEIAKKFSTEKSSKFIHGVLSSVMTKK